MKIAKLVTLTALVLVALNASANTSLHGGVLLSHSEERNVSLPEHLKNTINTSNSKQASTTASANYASGSHGTNVYASGNVGYQIYNGSTSRQYYAVDIYMCIANNNCMHTRNSFYLDPHINAYGGGPVYTSAYMPTAGKYEDEAIITVSGYESSTARGVNTVQIS